MAAAPVGQVKVAILVLQKHGGEGRQPEKEVEHNSSVGVVRPVVERTHQAGRTTCCSCAACCVARHVDGQVPVGLLVLLLFGRVLHRDWLLQVSGGNGEPIKNYTFSCKNTVNPFGVGQSPDEKLFLRRSVSR